MRSSSVFTIRRPFTNNNIDSSCNSSSANNNINNNNNSNSNELSDLKTTDSIKSRTESSGASINNELGENSSFELISTNNNNNNSLDSNNSTSFNNEFSFNSKIKKYNDSINQLTSSSSFENTKSIYDSNNNSKNLLLNPAFNRFFMQQTSAITTDNKICDKSKPTTQTQMLKITNNNNNNNCNNNFEFNNLSYSSSSSSPLVQGNLIKQQLNNNSINEKNLEVSDLKYNHNINNNNLEEQLLQNQQQLLNEKSRINNNNDLKQRTNYSNKSNPIVSNNEFTRFFTNKNQEKFNHNLIINRNNSNRIDSSSNNNYFLRNYDSSRCRSSCNINTTTNLNYYNSATESLGEESDYPSEFESSSIISNNSNIIIKNNHNHINNYDNTKKINGYHHYINNTNKNKTNRIKQLKQFQLNNNKSLQEIYLQQQQIKKSHNLTSNNNNNNNNNNNREISASRAVAEPVILSSTEIEDKEYLNDKATNSNNNSKRISYASITLRQPLKDINYFSDTEGLKTTYNRNRYRRVLTVSRNSNNNNNSISNSIDNIQNNSNNSNNYTKLEQLNNKTLSSLEPISKYNSNNTKTNKLEQKNTNNNTLINDQIINSFCQFYQPTSIRSQPTKVTMASSSYLNKPLQQQQQSIARPAQSFSKLGTQPIGPTYNALASPSYQKWTPSNQPTIQPITNYYNPIPLQQPQPQPQPQQQPQQQQQQQQPRYDDYSNQYQSYEEDEFFNDNIQYAERNESPLIDPVQERYERELGTELAKPSTSKPNYSDSYFYNSSVFNYPTIDEQKKLAKSIACSLEGGDPATSKFHKKKQNIQKSFFRDGYESEAAIQSSNYDYASQYGYQDDTAMYDQSYMYDESLPDVIKRSIAKAAMTNPIRNVHAPDSFKEQHFTEHVSHTQMPPKVALSLAQELEAKQREGGRGAALFQKRKARSERWVVEDQKKNSLLQNEFNEESAEPQFIQPRPQQPIQQQQPVQQKQPQQPQQPISHYVLPTVQNTNILNSKFSNNYNAKARGWGSSSVASSNYEKGMNEPILAESNFGKEEDFQNESFTNKSYSQAYTPTQYEMGQQSWNQQKNQQQQQQVQSNQMTRLNQSTSTQNEFNQQQQQTQQANESKARFNKLSSHENYLFNNRNAMNVINNTNANLNHNTNFNDNESTTSSSFHIYTGNPTYYHYDESIAASDL